ncbi:ABC transporter permease protein [Desulfonema ishimotonii]|uniref:ABC transporter permease protein n=1 Tax=Desulfonema ishimotonii TaxID=45657 RepID=A0A401FYB0_9BACT|nr:ABC transporter permease protein [Desulfonema ishimotonii]
MEEKRSKILQIIDSRTKVMALISIIAEALFLGSLVILPSDQTLYALIACLSILIVTLIGITIIEYTEVKSTKALIENKDILLGLWFFMA